MDRAVEESSQQCLPRGIRRVGNDRQPSTDHRTLYDCDLQVRLEVRDQSGEKRDQGVVVEGREKSGAKKQRRVGETRQDRSDPPALQAAVHHETGARAAASCRFCNR